MMSKKEHLKNALGASFRLSQILAPKVAHARAEIIGPGAMSLPVNEALQKMEADCRFQLSSQFSVGADHIEQLMSRLPSEPEARRDALIDLASLILVLLVNEQTDFFSLLTL